MSWDEKCKWLSANPVTAARQFQIYYSKISCAVMPIQLVRLWIFFIHQRLRTHCYIQPNRDLMRSLNKTQREILYHHRQCCKQSVISLKTGKPHPVYRLFVSGPGGVEKSHLIKVIHYDTVKLLRSRLCHCAGHCIHMCCSLHYRWTYPALSFPIRNWEQAT